MNEPVIRISNVGKRYVLGGAQRAGRTFREMLADSIRAPLTRAKGLAGVSATAETFWALQEIDLDVQQGDVVGIIGRNGAGKSTLLKILSRITAPTTGKIKFRGRLASLLEVGTGFHSELTGRENIFLSGAILGMTRKEIARKFDEIVAFAEVEQFLDTPVKHYSSGMYVRLAFAVAAHLESEILIVDEVLAVGDTAFQKKCLAKMESVAGHGRTVLFVSHNMAVVRTLCTRGVVLKAGRIAANTDIANAVDYYLKSDFNMSAYINWPEADAPKCEEVVLRKAYIADGKGSPISILGQHEGFSIVLEYEVRKSLKQMRVATMIQNSHGTLMCGSTDWGAWLPENRDPGIYTSICRFPESVFNDGHYSACFAIDAAPHFEPKLKTDYCISFDIEDFEGHGPRGHKLPGVIRPKMDWQVTGPNVTGCNAGAVNM